jgi:hypothetical protein
LRIKEQETRLILQEHDDDDDDDDDGWLKVETAVISPYIIKWSVCITETDSVYSVVRTRSFNALQVTVSFEATNRQILHAS